MIKTIELHNFKIFENQVFSISPFTIITGINGIGKSTVIQSLLLLKQSFEIGYLQTQNKVDLNNDYVNLEFAEDLCYTLAPSDNKKVDIIISLSNGNLYQWKIDALNPKSKILDCEFVGSKDFSDFALFDNNFIFLDAERWGPRELYNKNEKKAHNTKIGIQGELTPAYIANAISTNEEIKLTGLNHPKLRNTFELYENLNAWMSEILSLPIQTRLTEIDESKIKLSYNIEGAKGKSYSALQVGYGLTFCLPILVAILQAGKGDLIVIENPEAHLHPAAQSKMGKFLALASNLGVQIIIETHSEHIINGVRLSVANKNAEANDILINFFSKEKRSNKILVKQIQIQESGDLSEWPLDFFDQTEQDFIELLKIKSKK